MSFIPPENAHLVQAPEEVKKLFFAHRDQVKKANTLKQVVVPLLVIAALILLSQSLAFQEWITAGIAAITLLLSFLLFYWEKQIVKRQRLIRELMSNPEGVS